MTRAGLPIISPYTVLAFGLNALLDRGESVPVEVVKTHIRDGTLFRWLGDRCGADLNVSLFLSENAGEGHRALELFGSLASAVDERRKFGVEHNGFALL